VCELTLQAGFGNLRDLRRVMLRCANTLPSPAIFPDGCETDAKTDHWGLSARIEGIDCGAEHTPREHPDPKAEAFHIMQNA